MLNDLDLSRIKHVYVKPSRTDLRKGIDGLSAIVRADLKLDPTDGSLFLFCGARADRIKGLLYEGDGYLLLYKRCSVSIGHAILTRQRPLPRNSSTTLCMALNLIPESGHLSQLCTKNPSGKKSSLRWISFLFF